MFEEDITQSTGQVAVGDNLAALSVEDLEERCAALKAEIARVEAELVSKHASLAAADAVFGKA